MIRAALATAFALAVPPLIGGCAGEAAPLPQWTVTVATDAPVPQFGSRLQINVVDDAGDVACSSCQRQIAAADPVEWPISFGVAATRSGLHVRARLFRVGLIGPDGTPTPPALIDRLEALPPTSGDLRVEVVLKMKCFGVPARPGSHESCDPETGMLAPEAEAPPLTPADLPAVGSWPAARSVDCTGKTPADMVCIPGGAFIMGDPAALTVGGTDLATRPEHVVTLSPFRMDRDELTVAGFQALRAANPGLPMPLPMGSSIQDGAYCSYGAADTTLPLNCLTRSAAQAICAVQGKRLPTEAEWEYAAGNLTRETPYPWGDSDDVCGHAILARAGLDGPTLCRVAPNGGTYLAGPVGGGASGDVTDRGVHDLAGNVSEWVADDFQAYDAPCWNGGPTPLVDPLCADPAADSGSVRGGNWEAVPLAAVVTTRAHAAPSSASPLIGVRCARD